MTSRSGLTITGGKTDADDARGGGIFAPEPGRAYTLQQHVSANSTGGDRAYGGGIFSAETRDPHRSTVSGNSTAVTLPRRRDQR